MRALTAGLRAGGLCVSRRLPSRAPAVVQRPGVVGPEGLTPLAGAVNSCVIAANTMAKRAGVTTGMAIADARRRCPGIALVPQQPDLYTRVHHRIVAAVLDVLPIEAVCSIDEFAATVEPRDIPAALTHQIKQRLRDAVGDHIEVDPINWTADRRR